MAESKHISEGLEKGLQKFQEFASRMAEQTPPDEEIQNEKRRMQDEIIEKYRADIEGLHSSEREIWDVWTDVKKADVLKILGKVRRNRFFGKSKPPIDLTFLVVLCSQYNNGHIDRKLNKAYLWLVSNPGREKINYRRFIMNFMEDIKYENR